MFQLFVLGNPIIMSVNTILLVLVFVAAWKAPAWVKELGIMAFVVGLLGMALGLAQMLDVIHTSELENMPSVQVLASGLKATLTPAIYGMLIYVVSLIIRIVQKPMI